MIEDYIIVESYSDTELRRQILIYIKKGYMCQGGASVTDYKYIQAMIKYASNSQ